MISTDIGVRPLAGTSLGNKETGLGTFEQFRTMLFETENPSLDTAIATVPDERTGDVHTARVSERITAETYEM